MLTLLGSLLGFGTSLFPSLINFFKEKRDNRHELDMMDKQIQMQKELQSQRLEEVRIQSDADALKAAYENMNTFKGNSFTDMLNALVRPFITFGFFFMFCYLTIQILLYTIGLGMTALEVKRIVWDDEAQALFAAIVSFWFADRSLGKRNKK